MMYRPASNWNGHRPDRYTPGAHRELVRSLGPHRTPASPPKQWDFTPPVRDAKGAPLPSWLPACDE